MSINIRCNNLAFGYNGIALASASFEAKEQDYICIIGENGAGKSTFARTLLGLLPPVSGTINIEEHGKPCKIGYLPQQTLIPPDFPASVREVVMSGITCRNALSLFYSKTDKDRAEKIMEELHIPEELKSRRFGSLSGGQQQRVLLARAMCVSDKVLLLDEPVTGLDPEATAELYSLIRELNNTKRTIILMITHDMRALSDATHVLEITKGKATYRKNTEAPSKCQ